MPGRRRHIPDDIKCLIVHMDRQAEETLTRAQIRTLTGVAESTQRRILALHNKTGEVIQQPLENGRPRVLNGMNAAVSH
ncbi:hypothetical protein HYDPIDRAFT_110168 [Hydnomerulius pinastri MD-312]|uniref:Uncharacterized protein n=1 Tax=Hydnomerulius pinastri MD-312 TaxID=994086 RepID=A0A0C2L7J9_9AGAM|nr:hypothetical protein HYDPIDRAFT_120536 [Hydnomerulius pinastri MD-312]KIJ66037.1 hypothetical protein HYDPIDRAFT_110168 [Hydnomerulius pinastri MD-312]